MTEAELAMEEKLRKKRQEEQQIWQEYLKERSQSRQKEEDDLRKLKERQQRRKAQRAEQEQIMQEMRRKQDEARQRELEERRRKEAEAKRQRLEDAERKRLAMQEAIKRRDEEAKRNFIVPKRTNGSIPTNAGPMIVGMRDVMKTKEQLAEDKRIAMQYRLKPLKIDEGLRNAEIRKIVSDLWDSIVQLESDKYDLEEEQRRQEYHLKELTERQKQINKNKAVKMGLEMEDLSCKYPPKVRLASKYERRIDRRSFGEKTELFDGGYVSRLTKSKECQWEDKINNFKENHGDKHVPKWDPSAPRKDVYEPGTVIYEESDDEDDELVGKLRGYVKEAELERRSSNPVAEPRRKSSQMSTTQSAVQQTQAAKQQATRQQQQQQQRRHQEIEDDDDEEEDEEEYEEEEYDEEDE